MFVFLFFSSLKDVEISLCIKMAPSKCSFSQEYINGLRLLILSDIGCKEVCRDVLFNRERWSKDGVKLYNILKPRASDICQFRKQYELLCPSDGYTDYLKFDATLFFRIIKVMCERKYDELVKDLKYVRNRVFHRGNKELSDTDFNKLWKSTGSILLRHGFDLAIVDGLETGDPFLDQRFKDSAIFFQGR